MKHFMEIAGRRMAYLDEGQGPGTAVWSQLSVGQRHVGAANRGAQGQLSLHRSRAVGPRRFRPRSPKVAAPWRLWRGITWRCSMPSACRGVRVGGPLHRRYVGCGAGAAWCQTRLKGLVLMDSFVGLEPQITCERYLGMLAMIEQLGTVPAPIIEQVAPIFFASQPDEALDEPVSRRVWPLGQTRRLPPWWRWAAAL